MKYKEFVKLCFYNIRNSLEVENAKKILPIKTEEIEISLIDDSKISISSKKDNYIVYSDNEYFSCEEIVKAIASLYDIEYVDCTLRNLVNLQKKLYKVLNIDGGHEDGTK